MNLHRRLVLCSDVYCQREGASAGSQHVRDDETCVCSQTQKRKEQQQNTQQPSMDLWTNINHMSDCHMFSLTWRLASVTCRQCRAVDKVWIARRAGDLAQLMYGATMKTFVISKFSDSRKFAAEHRKTHAKHNTHHAYHVSPSRERTQYDTCASAKTRWSCNGDANPTSFCVNQKSTSRRSEISGAYESQHDNKTSMSAQDSASTF